MKLRGYVEEDFTQYKKPSMFLITPYCDFKCCIENGNNICQNMDVIKAPIIDVDNDELIKRYLNNPITKSIVFGGLEPMDSFEEVREFINTLRWDYNCFDDVVIYTGYNADEIIDQCMRLSKFANIIVKFGRFIPDQKSHFDEVLGVELASPNQYAVEL
jgi:hypothetical protein